MEKRYSLNCENFDYTEVEDAIRDQFNDDPDMKIGDVITIYEGDAVLWKAGDFADISPVDTLSERSYDEAGEDAVDWLMNRTKEQDIDLTQRIEAVVNQWADDHGLQPTFYRVENVKELQFAIISETGDYKAVG